MTFLTGLAIGVAIAALASFFLRTSLKKILFDLCGTQDRATFWAKYTFCVIFIMTVLFSLMPSQKNPDSRELTLGYLEAVFEDSLLGLLLALGAIGLQLARFTPNLRGKE